MAETKHNKPVETSSLLSTSATMIAMLKTALRYNVLHGCLNAVNMHVVGTIVLECKTFEIEN